MKGVESRGRVQGYGILCAKRVYGVDRKLQDNRLINSLRFSRNGNDLDPPHQWEINHRNITN